MSRFSAKFFSWIQGAAFYKDVHSEAVRLLPSGEGKTWLDVGCGPGLVTRLAGRHGYDALGIDSDPAMVHAARRLAARERCRFDVGNLETIASQHTGDVVSAASLLILLPDARLGLAWLWSCVRPGGTLLVVETTKEMNPDRAKAIRRSIKPGRRTALTLWAQARRGRSIDPAIFDDLGATTRQRHSLLGGLVDAWTFQRELQ